MFSAAQRLSEVQVVIGAAIGRLVRTAGAIGRMVRGAGALFTKLVSDQFFDKETPLVMMGGDVMASSGGSGVVAHPAKKNAVIKMIASDLNTPPLCG